MQSQKTKIVVFADFNDTSFRNICINHPCVKEFGICPILHGRSSILEVRRERSLEICASKGPESEMNSKLLLEVDIDTQIEAEAESLFQVLVQEAIHAPGDHGIPHNEIPIGCTASRLVKLRDGRAFYHRNYFACVWCITITQLLQYPIQRITGIVIRNANANSKGGDPKSGYLRIVMTQLHLLKWFGAAIEDKNLESAQDIYKVRKIHEDVQKRLSSLPEPPLRKPKKDRSNVLEAIRQDLAGAAHVPTPDPDWFDLGSIMTSNPKVPFSQFDMVMVLGIFYFLFDVNPSSVGLGHDPGSSYESYIYYVGRIGRYLGIEDRFNIAIHPNPAVRRAVSRKMVHNFMTLCLKHFREPEFQNLVYFSESVFLINHSFEVIIHMLVKDVLGICPASHTLAQCTRLQKVMYTMLRVVLILVRFRPAMCVANFVARVWLWVASFGHRC